MKRKRHFVVVLGMVLTGRVLAGSDLTTSNSSEPDATRERDSYEITIDGDTHVMKYNGTNYGKGTISYSVANSTPGFRSAHE